MTPPSLFNGFCFPKPSKFIKKSIQKSIKQVYNSGYVTLKANGAVICQKYCIYSDKRVKTNIQEMNHAESLDTLRLLQPSCFEYIDKIQNTSHPVDGLISQEVIENNKNKDTGPAVPTD